MTSGKTPCTEYRVMTAFFAVHSTEDNTMFTADIIVATEPLLFTVHDLFLQVGAFFYSRYDAFYIVRSKLTSHEYNFVFTVM